MKKEVVMPVANVIEQARKIDRNVITLRPVTKQSADKFQPHFGKKHHKRGAAPM